MRGSASAENVGLGGLGWVTGRVLCTWRMLGLAVKGPWLELGGPILTHAAQMGLVNTALTLYLAGKAYFVLNGYLLADNADQCMLVNEWVWLKS